MVICIAWGIRLGIHPQFFPLYRSLRDYANCLEKNESIGVKETWDSVRPQLVKILIKCGKDEEYRLPTLKQCYNDWKVWIRHVYSDISVKKYTFIKLEQEVNTNKSAGYPPRWREIDFKKDPKDLLEVFLDYSEFETISSRAQKIHRNACQGQPKHIAKISKKK